MSAMNTRWDALLGIAIGGVYTLSANCVLAQITPDATLPNNSIININGNTFNITGGTQAGTNLFHSFQEFSVRTGSQAFFINTVDIQNIISRVTGGSISNIDGLIRTLGAANLFLINPNGIVFGPNARLDIGGSFFASTASSLKFADGTEFRTDGTQTTPLLTISVPLGLQFGQNPGKIQVIGDGQGRRTTTNLIDTTNALRLGANQTLGLVGGDLEFLGGTLKSTGGRIELGSVGSESLVGLVPVANGWTLDYGGVQNFRDIQLLQGATVDASGIGGGNVRVQGRQITLKQGSVIEASTLGFQSGGTLEVTGIESVQLDGSGGTYRTALATQVYPGANGNGGNIILSTGSLSLTNGAQLGARTVGQGDAGSILVQAKDSVSAAGNSYIFSTVESGAVGKGGDINIAAATLSLKDSAQLGTIVREASNNQAAGQGQAGNVNVNVTGAVTIAGVKDGIRSGIYTYLGSGAIGKGGNINVTSGSFSLTDGAQLAASTVGQGDAGSILVQAKDSVSAGNSTIFSNVENGAVGKGGDVNINAATLSLKDGAQLGTFVREASDNLPGGQGQAGNVNVNVTGAVTIAGVKDGFSSGIFSSLGRGAIGKGGNINVTSGSVFLTDGAALSASTRGQGDAGKIQINATDYVSISGTSSITDPEAATGLFVRSLSSGAAGDIEVTAPQIRLDNGARFNAQSASGNGGNINLQVGDLLLLRRGSLISATAGTDKLGGDGGNITINAPSGFIVSAPNENSDITANAFNGTGGKIDINSLGIFNFTQRSREDLVRELGTDNPNELNPQQLPTNDITAFSLTNPTLGGQITINTPDADQSLGLVELPTVLAETSNLIADTGCDTIASTDSDTDKSKFTITGRGGLPPSPYEPLSSDVIWLDTRLSAITTQQQHSQGSAAKPPSKADAVEIVPATGWVFDGKGNVTLISNASNANGLASTPAGCAKK